MTKTTRYWAQCKWSWSLLEIERMRDRNLFGVLQQSGIKNIMNDIKN